MHDEQDRTSSFGMWLRLQRRARDLTQAELARRVGCTRDTIKRIEMDARRPSRQLAARIAAILAIPLEEREAVIQAARAEQAVDRLALPTWPESAPPSLTTGAPTRHQLPTPLPDFVGQQAAITALLASMPKATRKGTVAAISGVRGMGGIGKTELAILVANDLCESFPDAQIVLNLRGASANPLSPAQALQQVIHAFMPDAMLPDDLDALQRCYHSALHDKHVLILADDASDAAQVRPLTPPAGCALLVTSRQRFHLPGMHTIDLELFSEAEAVTLLRDLCDRLSEADARRMAQACGYLPLALRISGSLLRNDPALSVAGYLQQLADERRRLVRLRDPDDPQLDVEASLALGYAQLDPISQQVFRQLGVFVVDFTTALAQAVVEVEAYTDIGQLLHQMLRRNLLLYDTTRGRWRLHDLMRDLARRYLEAAGEWEPTMWRFARAAVQIAQEIHDHYLAGGEGMLAALARFDAEAPHINAARHWATSHAGIAEGDALLLADACATFPFAGLHYDLQHELIPQLEQALAAARRLNDQRSEANILKNLGNSYTSLGEPGLAITYHEQHRAIVQALGDRGDEGRALNNLGIAYRQLGNLQRAICAFNEALTVARVLGDQHGEGCALNNLGNSYAVLGEATQAILAYEQALALARALGHRCAERIVLCNLGQVYLHLGQAHHAMVFCEQAAAIAQALAFLALDDTSQALIPSVPNSRS